MRVVIYLVIYTGRDERRWSGGRGLGPRGAAIAHLGNESGLHFRPRLPAFTSGLGFRPSVPASAARPAPPFHHFLTLRPSPFIFDTPTPYYFPPPDKQRAQSPGHYGPAPPPLAVISLQTPRWHAEQGEGLLTFSLLFFFSSPAPRPWRLNNFLLGAPRRNGHCCWRSGANGDDVTTTLPCVAARHCPHYDCGAF